jgi:proton-dependent oligopeptide transporter, POT family
MNHPRSFDPSKQSELLGHPTGLYTLFFAEMWERFSYYGMRALLIFYMIKGFLGYGDREANAVYGAYTALVYMTPFFGGMIADRYLGSRVAVVIGGLLMAAGHLFMTVQTELMFFTALGLLIIGNGFFKPNISSMVGDLYPEGSHKRDAGFTIFYIGINLGAAMSPILCGYVGETYGWHYGFGIATIGMLVGLAVFVAPNWLTRILIGVTALASAVGMMTYNAGDWISTATAVFITLCLIASGVAAIMALGRGGLPGEVGMCPKPELFYRYLSQVLIGIAVTLPIFVLLVSGFSVIPGFDSGVVLLSESFLAVFYESSSPLVRGLGTVFEEMSRPAGLVLVAAGVAATVYLIKEMIGLEKIPRERMYVVLVLTFFSMFFWAVFEQQGSSINNFTDRNVDRVLDTEKLGTEMVGQRRYLRIDADPRDTELRGLWFLSQEYLGHSNDSVQAKELIARAIRMMEAKKESHKQASPQELDALIAETIASPVMTMTALTYLREYAKSGDAPLEDRQIEWVYNAASVGVLGVDGQEIPASFFQAVNAIYIILFGLLFSMLWAWMGNYEPSTAVKFAMGLIQLGMGFGCLWLGAVFAADTGMVAMIWLMLMYLLLTTGELCLSPVGLSMVTKLSPKYLVSTVMGAWFLATAFSQFLAAIIAQFAVVDTGESRVIPPPVETVAIYGEVYAFVALLAIIAGVILLVLSPILLKWMHEAHD